MMEYFVKVESEHKDEVISTTATSAEKAMKQVLASTVGRGPVQLKFLTSRQVDERVLAQLGSGGYRARTRRDEAA